MFVDGLKEGLEEGVVSEDQYVGKRRSVVRKVNFVARWWKRIEASEVGLPNVLFMLGAGR